jgi:membrane-associated protease RseP (regulator of RpoE activity)
VSHVGVVILGAVVFFALILVSVGLHEVGHFLPGKGFHVKILQFFIGFGKNLWSTQRGETQYGVKMIPLGGYVRLLGMYPPKREGKNTWLKRLADSAREAEWEDITEADIASQRLFYQKPLWQRLIIMFSGVAMNLLLAFLLFAGVNLAYGESVVTTQIASVQQCVDPAAATCEPTPAAAMGLQVGDDVQAFNGVDYGSWADLTAAVRANGGDPVQLRVVRGGQTLELPTVPGHASTVTEADGTTVQVGLLGVTAGQAMVRVGPLDTVHQMWDMTAQAVTAIVALPGSVVTTVQDMVGGRPRDLNSPISIVGASVIAGDVVAADAPVEARAAFYLRLLGSINLFVGVMNLIPLPPFDGGQIAAGIYEAIRRGVNKLRRRPDPGPADTARLLPVTYIVVGLFAIMGAVLVIADIINPVALG